MGFRRRSYHLLRPHGRSARADSQGLLQRPRNGHCAGLRGRVAARFHHHLTVCPSRASMEVKENDRHMHHLSGCRESNLPGPQGVGVAGQGAHWPLDSVLALISATAFAAHAHRNQRRKDANRSPYINHPFALMDVLANEAGRADPTMLAAAVLHDTIEDTEMTSKRHSGRKSQASCWRLQTTSR